MKKCVFLATLFMSSVCHAEITPGTVVWADAYYMARGSNSINHQQVSGGSPEELVGGLDFPRRLVIDESGEKLYWSSSIFGAGSIQRSNFDGTGVEYVIPSVDAWGIDIDPRSPKLYWANHDGHKIQRSDLDGSNIEVVTGTSMTPWALAVDPVNSKLYYSESNGASAKIFRLGFDGSGKDNLLATTAGSIRGLELDLTNDKVYWHEMESGISKIGRANFDGSDLEYIIEGLIFLDDIALDVDADRIYWTRPPHGADPPLIQYANLDGSAITTLVDTGLNVPRGIEVVAIPEPGTVCLLGLGGVLIRRKEGK